MSSTTLPNILASDIAARNTSESCYVTVGTKVYDITDFLDAHPGGGELILEYGGKDITEILKDEVSHKHSEAAYEILDDALIGYVATEKVLDTATKSEHPDNIIPLPPNADGARELKENGAPLPVYANTGMSSEADLERETDIASDYKVYKFLDLNKPLIMQVWRGGFTKKFYLEQIHRPRHYKGGASAPLFGNFLEPLTKTSWWVIPTVWVPPVAYGLFWAAQGLGPFITAAYWFLGLLLWTLVEYILHRCLFHVDEHLPDNRVALTAHFLLHGIHHYLPMDKLRLVMPPTLFLALASPFWRIVHAAFFYNYDVGTAAFCGGVTGYILYDLCHYFLHHRTLPGYFQALKKYHLQHHFMDFENGFGVTSRFWDVVFGTELQAPLPSIAKTI